MIEVLNLRVYSLELDYLDLSWEVGPSTENVLDYLFLIERSESPMGPWDQISNSFTDKYAFRDVHLNQQHRHRVFYYRLKITHTQTSEVAYSEVGYQRAFPDLNALEVRRLEMVLFKEQIGWLQWIGFALIIAGVICVTR